MIHAKTSGSFRDTTTFLTKMSKGDIYSSLDAHGAAGVAALESATPIDSSETASSWSYEIIKEDGRVSIVWSNSHEDGGAPVAVLIQYGHTTRNGGYVEGRDYINPAMRPIFDQIADDVWKEVTS
jgi:hypothetical protein